MKKIDVWLSIFRSVCINNSTTNGRTVTDCKNIADGIYEQIIDTRSIVSPVEITIEKDDCTGWEERLEW